MFYLEETRRAFQHLSQCRGLCPEELVDQGREILGFEVGLDVVDVVLHACSRSYGGSPQSSAPTGHQRARVVSDDPAVFKADAIRVGGVEEGPRVGQKIDAVIAAPGNSFRVVDAGVIPIDLNAKTFQMSSEVFARALVLGEGQSSKGDIIFVSDDIQMPVGPCCAEHRLDGAIVEYEVIR